MGWAVRESAARRVTVGRDSRSRHGPDAHLPYHRIAVAAPGTIDSRRRAARRTRWPDHAAPHRTDAQCGERRRLHCSLRRRGPERHHHGVESQSHEKGGARVARGDHEGSHRAVAAGADDRHCGHPRHAAGGAPHWSRERRPARHRHGGGRRSRDRDGAHLVRAALDVSCGRALGRAAPWRGAMGLSMSLRMVAGAAVAAVAAACAVGPNFHRPAPPQDLDYGNAPAQGTTAAAPGPGGNAQQLIGGMDIPGEWWELFQSPNLTALIGQALKGNPNLDAARAALRQAHDLYKAQRATLLSPTVQGSFSALRAKNPVDTLANPTNLPQENPYYNLFTAQLDLSYMPDVFGGSRRALEASRAQVEATRFELIATYVTLSSNVVNIAVQEASLRGQIAATDRLLALQHQLTDTVQHQQSIGTASTADLLLQQAAEAQTAATLPPLQKQLGQTRDALTALLGRLPAEEPAETFRLEQLPMPKELPVSLQSKVIEQRPDVRQAEENLHAATAQVGVALADMLPQFTISANTGSAALAIGSLFGANTGFWSLGASLSQTLFDAGELLHKKRAAEAGLDQAGDLYRATVILACQNVADTLRALQADADALKASAEADRAAKASFDLAREQYKNGSLSAVGLLLVEQTYQQAEVAVVQAQANRYADTAGLFQALGGGWWNLPEVTFK